MNNERQLINKINESILSGNPSHLSNYHFFHTLVDNTRKKKKDNITILLNTSNSQYIRFIEVLYFFEIDINDYFLAHLYYHNYPTQNESTRIEGDYSNDDIKRVRDNLLYKIPRSQNNIRSIEPYIETLCYYMQNNLAFLTRNNYCNRCANLFIKDSVSIISSYDNFKSFIESCYILFFDSINIAYTLDKPADILILSLEYKPMLSPDTLVDIISSHSPRIDLSKEICSLADMCHNRVDQLLDFNDPTPLQILTGLCINWDIIIKIISNKELDGYLSHLLKEDDYILGKKLDEGIIDSLERRPQLAVLNNSINYAYLFNYVTFSKVNAYTPDKIKKILYKKIDEN